MYRETLQDRAHAFMERAAQPVPATELVRAILGFGNVTPDAARKLTDALLKRDARFQRVPRRGWQLSVSPGMDQALDTITFTVLDTETTGSAPPARVTEVGAVRVRRARMGECFHSLVDAGTQVPEVITAITGITNDMLQGAPRPEEVMPAFRRFLGSTVLVAHNLPFDRQFLEYEFDRAGCDVPGGPALCTLALCRKLLNLRGNDLSQVARHFRIPVLNRHRALGDALATARVLVCLIQRLKEENILTLGEVLDLLKPSRARRRKPP